MSAPSYLGVNKRVKTELMTLILQMGDSLEGFCVSETLVERDADQKTGAEKDPNQKVLTSPEVAGCRFRAFRAHLLPSRMDLSALALIPFPHPLHSSLPLCNNQRERRKEPGAQTHAPERFTLKGRHRLDPAQKD